MPNFLGIGIIWVISSVGRASRLQRESQRFESVITHMGK